MIMRRLRDLPSDILDFCIEHRWKLTIIVVILILIGLFFATNKNYYHGVLFYPDKTKTSLIYEKRSIVYGKNKLDRINKIVEELLLGPVNMDMVNIFPVESKLLSSSIENDTLILNLNRETVMNINWEKNKDVSIYELLVQCIVDSVCFQDHSIKKVKLYFNGKYFRFIGDYGPFDKGIKPNWKILKK